MRRRSEQRRRLLWAAVLLALVMSVAVLSVVDAVLRIYDRVSAATRDRCAKPKPFGTAHDLRRAMPA